MKKSSSHKMSAEVKSFWVGFLSPVLLPMTLTMAIAAVLCLVTGSNHSLLSLDNCARLTIGASLLTIVTSPVTVIGSLVMVAFGKAQTQLVDPDPALWLLRFVLFGAMLGYLIMLPFGYMIADEEEVITIRFLLYPGMFFGAAFCAVVAIPISTIWWRERTRSVAVDTVSSTSETQEISQ